MLSAVTDHWALFERSGGWRFARIDGFDRRQQAAYLRGLYTGGLREMFPRLPRRSKHLLQIPVVLAMIRELAAAGELPRFQTRGDLYLRVHEHFTTQAARRLADRDPELKVGARERMRWREILAATACEMMARGYYNYAVQGDDDVLDVQQAPRPAARNRSRRPNGN